MSRQERRRRRLDREHDRWVARYGDEPPHGDAGYPWSWVVAAGLFLLVFGLGYAGGFVWLFDR